MCWHGGLSKVTVTLSHVGATAVALHPSPHQSHVNSFSAEDEATGKQDSKSKIKAPEISPLKQSHNGETSIWTVSGKRCWSMKGSNNDNRQTVMTAFGSLGCVFFSMVEPLSIKNAFHSVINQTRKAWFKHKNLTHCVKYLLVWEVLSF